MIKRRSFTKEQKMQILREAESEVMIEDHTFEISNLDLGMDLMELNDFWNSIDNQQYFQ